MSIRWESLLPNFWLTLHTGGRISQRSDDEITIELFYDGTHQLTAVFHPLRVLNIRANPCEKTGCLGICSDCVTKVRLQINGNFVKLCSSGLLLDVEEDEAVLKQEINMMLRMATLVDRRRSKVKKAEGGEVSLGEADASLPYCIVLMICREASDIAIAAKVTKFESKK